MARATHAKLRSSDSAIVSAPPSSINQPTRRRRRFPQPTEGSDASASDYEGSNASKHSVSDNKKRKGGVQRRGRIGKSRTEVDVDGQEEHQGKKTYSTRDEKKKRSLSVELEGEWLGMAPSDNEEDDLGGLTDPGTHSSTSEETPLATLHSVAEAANDALTSFDGTDTDDDDDHVVVRRVRVATRTNTPSRRPRSPLQSIDQPIQEAVSQEPASATLVAPEAVAGPRSAPEGDVTTTERDNRGDTKNFDGAVKMEDVDVRIKAEDVKPTIKIEDIKPEVDIKLERSRSTAPSPAPDVKPQGEEEREGPTRLELDRNGVTIKDEEEDSA
ncbi:hypothetical protein P7C70_g8199, partial [Phenoliferia sp. Uapishka_3]